MSSNYNPPPIPGTSGYMGQGSYGATSSPYFTIANQFLPRNLHDVIRWARYITTQSPVVSEVIRKYSTYPITEFLVESPSKITKEKYTEIFKQFKLKPVLHDIGFEYHSMGNVFVSIYFPIHRSLECPHCGTQYNAKKAEFTTFRNFKFEGICPKCSTKASFNRKDTKSLSIEDMNLIKWDPTHIAVNHNPITNEQEYYYKIPGDIKRRIREGDKLFVNSIPWGFVEAVQKNQDFKFDRGNLFHMKNMTTGNQINGIAVPPLISLFNLVFYQATLRKANEAISLDFMNPLRVIYPAAQTANSDPVISISMKNFSSRMESALIKHKQDKNHILVAPMPIGYQAVSGEGKNLLVSAEIEQAETSILLALGVSRELLSGLTNWTSSTVGLRLLENALLCYTAQVEELVSWIMERVSKYIGIETCPVTLTPFKLSDDDNLRQMLTVTAQSGLSSTSTLFEAFGLDYEKEQGRIISDNVMKAETSVKSELMVKRASYMASKQASEDMDDSEEYQNSVTQAHQLAEQLYNADESVRRSALNQLETHNYAIYLMVSKLLEKYRESEDHQEMVDKERGETMKGVPSGGKEGGTNGDERPTAQPVTAEPITA